MNPIVVYRKIANYLKRQRDQYSLRQRIARSIFLMRNRKPLGIKTEFERLHEETLRKDMEMLPVEAPGRTSPAENKWIKFKNAIRLHAATEDARTFLSWPPVRHNMHYTPDVTELDFIKLTPNWDSLEKALASKSSVLTPFFAFPSANENAVRQAFHFEKFRTATNIDLDDIDQIFEFGGGYGSMCLLLNRLGFKGRYVIFDWPELSRLQRYYLSLEGVRGKISYGTDAGADIYLISSVPEIARTIDRSKRTLIIGTWSLSECSVALRESIFREVNPAFFLISYQKRFGEVDNQAYFEDLQKTRKEFSWKTEPIAYIPSEKNMYLFGVKK